jgi:hypothetical protein
VTSAVPATLLVAGAPADNTIKHVENILMPAPTSAERGTGDESRGE